MSYSTLPRRNGFTASGSTPRVLVAVASVLIAAILALLVIDRFGGSSAQIIRNAVCSANAGQIDCNSAGLGGLVKAANDLISPVFVALIAVCPIACLVGAAAIMFGNRRGLVILGSALGALVLAGAVRGIVA
jgi:hypothetical protein